MNVSQTLPIKQKSNKILMLLSFFGILMVLDSHLATNLNLLGYIFPSDSFFMPMFVFVSGYFFIKEVVTDFKSTGKAIFKKIVKLLIPYLLLVGVTYLFELFTNSINYTNLNFFNAQDTLNCVFFYGVTFGFNDPTWFVITLFYVSVIYIILRYVFKFIWNDLIVLVLLIILGSSCIYFSQTSLNDIPAYTCLFRICFFLQFYQLGICFRKYAEKFIQGINVLVIIIACILINCILIGAYGNNLQFVSCAFMKGFKTNNHLLPLITSITGILFWYCICKGLAKVIGESKFVNFVSNNTFFIMGFHLVAKFFFNSIIALIYVNNSSLVPTFNMTSFKSDVWYLYGDLWLRIICFIFTLFFTLLCCFAYNKCKLFLKKKMSNLTTHKIE